MNISIRLFALLLCAATPVRAATNFVILGDDFQVKINAAAPGDTLVVQAGVYPGNLNFNKPLTVLRSGTNQIQLLGTVQITGAGNSSFQFAQFSSAVTIQATGTVSFVYSQFLAPVTSQAANVLLSQSTCSNAFAANLTIGSGTNLQVYDSSFYNTLSVSGGRAVIKRCRTFDLTLSNNVALEAMRMTNFGYAHATATAGSGTPFVAVQSSFADSTFVGGYKVWIGYSLWNTYGGLSLTNCDTVLIGNSVMPSSFIPASIVSVQGGSLKAYNNRIRVDSVLNGGGGGNGAPDFYCMSLNSTSSEIINNTFAIRRAGGGQDVTLHGIRCAGGGSSVIKANIVYLHSVPPTGTGAIGIENSGATLAVSYCDVANGYLLYSFTPFLDVGPVVNCISADPFLAADGTLNTNSPCINTGPPEAIHNDRDGTRNDMGYTGGPYWNPANCTNDNPMVFFLTGSPQTVLKGVQTNILVSVGASAGH